MSESVCKCVCVEVCVSVCIRVCKAPRLCQIKPNFFLVVRFVLNSMCMKFGVNRSMFTGSRLRF